jgi:signal transduction histidine kinase
MTYHHPEYTLKNPKLAHWLQDHTEMFGTTKKEVDGAFHTALFENLIDMLLHGQPQMMESILESAATHAVAVRRDLTDLLAVPQLLRERIWRRLGEEIDPEPAFVMLTDLDAAFVHIIRTMIDMYEEASKMAQSAKASEISRLYSASEQKVMQYAAEVSRANRELARLEKAKTDFISIAAHELKTPLTLIQGYVDILEELKVNERVDGLVRRINRGTERMNLILNDMLDLTAIDTGQLNLVIEPVNLKAILELVITQAGRILRERGQTIRTQDLDTLPPIEADGQRIHHIF